MTSNVEESQWDIFGATVRGPGHVADRQPNQDAWGHGRAGLLRVIAVSDGLGSRPYSRDGARAACRAVMEATRQWSRFPMASPEILLGLIHLLWRARIAPQIPKDSACTCLFTAIAPDGSGIVAQLGDGLILVKDSTGLQALTQRVDGDFTNETHGLGTTTSLSSWKVRRLEKNTHSVIMCTDGVADDLLPNRLTQFSDWLIGDIKKHQRAKRRYALARELRAWPTPHHIDDKTIAVVCGAASQA